MELTNIQDTFYIGNFLDFEIIIDKKTGYFNATNLCKQKNKIFSKWYKLQKSKNLLKILNNTLTEKPMYNVKHIDHRLTGSYVCKEIIIDVSCWLSCEFNLKCNKILLNYFEQKIKNKKSDFIIKQLENLSRKVNCMDSDIKDTLEDILDDVEYIKKKKPWFNFW